MVGTDPGASKHDKAVKLGVPVLDDDGGAIRDTPGCVGEATFMRAPLGRLGAGAARRCDTDATTRLR